MPDLLSQYMSANRHMAMEPIPHSNLINDTQDLKIPVEKNCTYLVRVANIGAFMGQEFRIDGHTLTIVEVDGVYTKPAETNMIYLAAGQRYSFLLQTRHDVVENHPMLAKTDTVTSSFSVFSDK